MADHPLDLLAALALDALTDEERAEVLAHVATCPGCRSTLASYRTAAALLPLSLPEHRPPPDLRDRILAAAQGLEQLPAPEEVPAQAATAARPPGRRDGAARGIGRRLSLLIAAALAVVAAALGVWNASLQQQIKALQAATPRTVALAPATAGTPASGTATLVPGQPAVLGVVNLPPPGAGKVYEAWVIDKGGPKPAGTFVTTGDGHGAVVLTQPASLGDTIAVTAEPSPGTQTPTGAILLKGTAGP